ARRRGGVAGPLPGHRRPARAGARRTARRGIRNPGNAGQLRVAAAARAHHGLQRALPRTQGRCPRVRRGRRAGDHLHRRGERHVPRGGALVRYLSRNCVIAVSPTTTITPRSTTGGNFRPTLAPITPPIVAPTAISATAGHATCATKM